MANVFADTFVTPLTVRQLNIATVYCVTNALHMYLCAQTVSV